MEYKDQINEILLNKNNELSKEIVIRYTPQGTVRAFKRAKDSTRRVYCFFENVRNVENDINQKWATINLLDDNEKSPVLQNLHDKVQSILDNK